MHKKMEPRKKFKLAMGINGVVAHNWYVIQIVSS